MSELADLFRDIFADPDLRLDAATTAADIPGWDSMKHIEIVVAVEEKYAVRLRAREVDDLRSVGDLAALIEARTA